MKASDKFEQRIQRIHELIEHFNSEVTWNDRIPDPDNPLQGRQIDVTIQKNKKLTIIECRIHKKPQDVKWIEELIGRRLSLNADIVIAVSASGFTEGAIKKANKYGIILRDFRTLTEQEIATWSHRTKAWLTFLKYWKVGLMIYFDKTANKGIDVNQIREDLQKGPTLFLLFDLMARQIDDKLPLGKRADLHASCEPKQWVLDGKQVKQVVVEADVEAVRQYVSVPYVLTYGAPDVVPVDREIVIEKMDLGDSEVSQRSNIVSMFIDLSGIITPKNSQFRTILVDMGRIVNGKISIVGVPELKMPVERIEIRISYA